MKEEMNYFEILMKLIGTVTPYGSTHIDEERFENLKQLCEMADSILLLIHEVAQYKERHEFSMKEIGEYAYKFLNDLKK